MTTRVDDRTQVQLVTLKTEAQQLRTWMERRTDVALRRREGPLQAARHRLALLEREVPRLEREVTNLQRRTEALNTPHPPLATGALAVVRGLLLGLTALVWLVGVVTLTPASRFDDPLRLVAFILPVALIALGRR